MNIFRLTGDLLHLLAIITLLLTIWKRRSCCGISGKSQILLAMVYITRYLDLFTIFISLYNSIIKIVFITTTLATLYLMYVKFEGTNDRKHDKFRIEFLLISVALLALLVNHEFTTLEILWTFSIYLESVAILPQLFLISETDEDKTIASYYWMALGSYRALYLINWIWRYYFEGFYDLIAIVSGIVQIVLILFMQLNNYFNYQNNPYTNGSQLEV
jgi:ER lumen protein retaining receptor